MKKLIGLLIAALLVWCTGVLGAEKSCPRADYYAEVNRKLAEIASICASGETAYNQNDLTRAWCCFTEALDAIDALEKENPGCANDISAEVGVARKKVENLFAEKFNYGQESPDKLLVLLVGQSNMAGRGYAGEDDLTLIPNLLMIRPDFRWQPAVDPVTRDRYVVGLFDSAKKKIKLKDPYGIVLPGKGEKICGVGMGRTFGKLLLAANPGKTVGLIPCAVGGTSVLAWTPGAVDPSDKTIYPYDQAIAKAREAQKSGKIVAILWHQGESDAARHTPEYREKLQTIIANFRRDLNLGAEVPFIAGEIVDFNPEKNQGSYEIINQALAEIAQADSSFRLVKLQGMHHRGDKLHFDTASYHEMGKRYFDAYQKFQQERNAK